MNSELRRRRLLNLRNKIQPQQFNSPYKINNVPQESSPKKQRIKSQPKTKPRFQNLKRFAKDIQFHITRNKMPQPI